MKIIQVLNSQGTESTYLKLKVEIAGVAKVDQIHSNATLKHMLSMSIDDV
jgi:hypothetical protein